MLKFEFQKERLIQTPSIMLFPEFRAILDMDKSEDKKRANQLLYYVFLMSDISEDNPIRDKKDKEAEARLRAFGSKKGRISLEETLLVNKAINVYIKHNQTPEERLLRVFDKMADKLRKVLSTTEPEVVKNVKEGVVMFTSNSDIISDGLEELNIIHKKREVIVAAITRSTMTTRVRGQMKLSPLSKGAITLVNDNDARDYYKNLELDDNPKTIQRESLSRIEQFKAERIKQLKKTL